MARAKSSLPVPDSPKSSTVASLLPIWGRMRKTLARARLLPTMSSKVYVPSTLRRMIWISVKSRKVSTPPMTPPSLPLRGAALMDTGTFSPSGRTMKMDLLESWMSLARQASRAHSPSHRLERKTSQHLQPTASSRGMPVMRSAAALKEVMVHSRSTVNTPSAMESRMASQGRSKEVGMGWS